jgi:hypothetical protein
MCINKSLVMGLSINWAKPTPEPVTFGGVINAILQRITLRNMKLFCLPNKLGEKLRKSKYYLKFKFIWNLRELYSI